MEAIKATVPSSSLRHFLKDFSFSVIALEEGAPGDVGDPHRRLPPPRNSFLSRLEVRGLHERCRHRQALLLVEVGEPQACSLEPAVLPNIEFNL